MTLLVWPGLLTDAASLSMLKLIGETGAVPAMAEEEEMVDIVASCLETNEGIVPWKALLLSAPVVLTMDLSAIESAAVYQFQPRLL